MVHFKVKYFSVIEKRKVNIKTRKKKANKEDTQTYPKIIRNLHKFLAFYKKAKNKESMKH